MKYKMVAIDMDGTLLNSEKRVTDRTKKALVEAQKKGIKIVITTGRILTSARIYSDYIGLKTPIIASNGAIIKGVGNEKIFKTFPINEKTIIEAAKICEDIDIPYFFYSEDKIYSPKNLELFKFYLQQDLKIDSSYHIPIRILKNISSGFTIEEEILKLNIWEKNETKIMMTLAKLNELEDTIVTSSSPGNIELTNAQATKGNAIKNLAEYYQIDREEIIAIGDSYNDQSMIEYAGLGVAMDNARTDIKKIADYITASNDQDGVALILEKFLI